MSFKKKFIDTFDFQNEEKFGDAIKKNTRDVKKNHRNRIRNSERKHLGTIEDANLTVSFVFDNAIRKFRKAKKMVVDLSILFDLEFDRNDYLRGFEKSWKVYVSERVLLGVKVGDNLALNFLYKYFYPKARQHVKGNSGSSDDVWDLLQDVLTKLFIKCMKEGDKGKNYQHNNVLALVWRMINFTWLDILRKKKSDFEKLKEYSGSIKKSDAISENGVILSRNRITDKINIIEEFQLSERFVKKLYQKFETIDCLDYDKLKDEQKDYIEVLIDFGDSHPIGKKILFIGDVLPRLDRETLAEEMGYLQLTDNKETKNRGKAIFSSSKSRYRVLLEKYLINKIK